MAWVMVVEDDRADADIIRRACASVMPEVRLETFLDAESALARLETAEEMPAFILTDIHLGGTSGIILAQTIRARWSVPVVVTTGSTLESDRSDSRRVGADHFFVKPTDFFRLQDECRTMRDLWIAP